MATSQNDQQKNQQSTPQKTAQKPRTINYDKLMTAEIRNNIEIYLESMLAIGADINQIVLRLSIPVIKKNLELLKKNGAKLEDKNFVSESTKRHEAHEQEMLALIAAGTPAREFYDKHRFRSLDDVRFLIKHGMSALDYFHAVPGSQLANYMEIWLDYPDGIDFQKLVCATNPRALVAFADRISKILPDYDFDKAVMRTNLYDVSRHMEKLMLAGVTPAVLVDHMAMDSIIPNIEKLLDYGATPEQLLGRLSSKSIALNYGRLIKHGMSHEQLFAYLEADDLAERQDSIKKAGAPANSIAEKLAST